MPNNSLVSLEKFHELAKSGQVPEDTGIVQAIPDAVEFVSRGSADSERDMVFTISTASVDRVGDSINQDGWDLAAYKKNPVVLWAHDRYSLPVARSKEIWTDAGKLKAIPEFVGAELSRFADAVRRYYEAGFLKAASVGFMPTKWAWSEDKDRKFGIDFEKQELLEWSAVPVPANAEALMGAKAAGIDVTPIREWAASAVKLAGGFETIRDFEGFLRDAGFSRADAKLLASHGWSGLDQRDVEPFVACLQQFSESLKRS